MYSLDATIITKHHRSLGYGFVTFETEKEAQKAAKDLDTKSLDGREINVEVARPKVESTVDEPKKTRKSKRNARRRSSKSATAAPTKEESILKINKDIVPVKKEEDVNVKKEINVKEETPVVKKEVVATAPVVLPAETDANEQDQEKTAEQIAKEAAARRKRNQKNKKRQNKKKSIEKATRVTEPSKTALFVANLPYATTDDDLNKIFKDYKLVSAHVARMNNGCSKGYGFVELENEEEQSKALESVKDVVLEGRSIYLKIALSEQKVPALEDDVITIKTEVKVEEPIIEIKKEATLSKDSVVDALKVKDTKK